MYNSCFVSHEFTPTFDEYFAVGSYTVIKLSLRYICVVIVIYISLKL